MLGKISEATCRLNVYMHRPDGTTRSISADAWGYGQVSGRKCLVVRDIHSQILHVLGAIILRDHIAKEDRELVNRVKVVEEGVVSTDRREYQFLLDDIDAETKRRVTSGPLVEPSALVGHSLRL